MIQLEEQLAFLQKLGCARVQGFLFMPAVSAARAGQLLGRSVSELDSD